ncbi:L-amino acid N-acyltransferase YncA [Pedobacter steynii]|uniref:L-amino acid N-acyltransferase YncA n=1 Tax=Pedobacter steynii TaxID=430522 RepID=A0A1H0KK54_9SPHI|nr:GNAT family N-acetyltransferase [Pedobacter steynii]NQX43314.1 GNAT family N-acetyltransferase [Pedobacter steynii]SDO56327.1 L-amino acid N-acyltransferase YncA [Pedobacter steynii]
MLHIYNATSSDFPIIQEIAYITWPDTFGAILSKEQISYMVEMMYSTAALTEQTTQKKHQYLLVKDETKHLGYASYELNYKGLSKTKIHKIYILPEAQGKGVGKLLMNTITDIARKNQDTILSLNVNRDNAAFDFYKNIGFEKVGEENIDIGDGFLMEDFIMDKKLV